MPLMQIQNFHTNTTNTSIREVAQGMGAGVGSEDEREKSMNQDRGLEGTNGGREPWSGWRDELHQHLSPK